MTAPGNRAAMKKSQRELRAAAGDMLSQLWPPSVLRDARELLLKFQRDEVFREYLSAHLWAVLAMPLLFVLISTVCAIDIMFNSVRLIPPPVPVWYRGFALLLGATVWRFPRAFSPTSNTAGPCLPGYSSRCASPCPLRSWRVMRPCSPCCSLPWRSSPP